MGSLVALPDKEAPADIDDRCETYYMRRLVDSAGKVDQEAVALFKVVAHAHACAPMRHPTPRHAEPRPSHATLHHATPRHASILGWVYSILCG